MKCVLMVYSGTAYAGYPLDSGGPAEASEIYFLSPPFGGQPVMAVKGIEEERSPASRTCRLDREARNDARRAALETIRQIRKLSDTIQHEEVF